MTNQKIIVVGYTAPAIASLEELRPAGSVILIEEPDVIRKRNLESVAKESPVIDQLISFEYQKELAADLIFPKLKSFNVVSVIPTVEYSTTFVARLAERFSLPGAGFAASMLFRDKDKLRKVTNEYNVNNPKSQLVNSLKDAQEFFDSTPGPIIIKPANRQGSVGTVIVHDSNELESAWLASKHRDEGVFVPDRGLPEKTLIEQFITGTEYSVEALVKNGEILFSNVTQKELFEGVNPVERSHYVPAHIDSIETNLLVNNTKKVLDSVGFDTGIIHCEWILSDGIPFLVECAGRFAGDGIIYLIEKTYEFDIVDAFHKLMRGEALPNLPTDVKHHSAVRFLGGKNALIKAIKVDEKQMTQEGIDSYTIMMKAGDQCYTPKMSWQRLGFIYVIAKSPSLVIQTANSAEDAVTVSYEEV